MTEETIEVFEQRTVGQILRSAREKKEISIEGVSKILCISKRQLVALEEDESHVCDVYTLGFVRSYSLFLGVDPDEMVQKFKDNAASPKSSSLSFPAPLPGRGIPSFRIICLSLVILFSLIAGWEWYGYQESTPFQKEDLVVSATPVPIEDVTYAPYIPPPPLHEIESTDPFENIVALTSLPPVLLTVVQESWVEVKDTSGKVIVSRLFQPGETYEFQKPQDLVLKTGNASGIQLSSGEKKYTLSSEGRRVKADIPLDPEKWLEESPGSQ